MKEKWILAILLWPVILLPVWAMNVGVPKIPEGMYDERIF
jgi:hypothetical protein